MRLVSKGLAGEIADSRIVSAFGDVVIDALFFILPSQLARNLGGEVVRQGEEDFRAEGLQQGAPCFARQGGLERTDALRRYQWDTLSLSG